MVDPPDRRALHPGDSPQSDGSVFSEEGDKVMADLVQAGQMQTAVLDPLHNSPGRPASPAAGLPDPQPIVNQVSSHDASSNDPTSVHFSRAVHCQKEISDLLFDTSTKLTNPQRAKILGLLRQIIQECADLRTIAAHQSGRVEELRFQLLNPARQLHPVSSTLPPGSGLPVPSYAMVAARGQSVQESPSPGRHVRVPAPGLADALPGPSLAVTSTSRQDHSYIMFLTPLVPTTSPAADVLKLLKSNIDPAKAGVSEIILRQTKLGITVLTNQQKSIQNLQKAIEENTVTSTSISVRIPKKRRPRLKLTGVDPDVPASRVIPEINDRNPSVNLDLANSKIIASYKEKSGNITHVIEVLPADRRQLLQCRQIVIGWTVVTAVDDFHVPMCTYCATYGHSRRACPNAGHPDKVVCTKCAQNHLAEQCAVRSGDDAVACNECRKLGRPSSHPTGHIECPVLVDRVARLRARTDYG